MRAASLSEGELELEFKGGLGLEFERASRRLSSGEFLSPEMEVREGGSLGRLYAVRRRSILVAVIH